MNYVVYILKSESTGRFYVGSTDDLAQRVREHNTGKSRATRNRGPWHLCWSRQFSTRAEAVRFERYVKSQKSRRVIEDLIRSSMGT